MIMDDEDPSNNGGATIVFILFSIIKWVHICDLPSSMLTQNKIICKIEIRIDEKHIQYKERQSQESWNKKSFQNQPQCTHIHKGYKWKE